jgi:hypothetical protein
VSRNAAGAALALHLFFVESYAAVRQFQYTLTPTNDLLTDLTLAGVDALKVSFSLVDATEDYYNIFILQVLTAGGTNIIRYSTDLTSTAASTGPIRLNAGYIEKHYSLALSDKTNTLFRDKLDNDEIQIMTFEYACTCSVFEISEFICFGASLECTVAVQNYNTDCTNEATTTQTNV